MQHIRPKSVLAVAAFFLLAGLAFAGQKNCETLLDPVSAEISRLQEIPSRMELTPGSPPITEPHYYVYRRFQAKLSEQYELLRARQIDKEVEEQIAREKRGEPNLEVLRYAEEIQKLNESAQALEQQQQAETNPEKAKVLRAKNEMLQIEIEIKRLESLNHDFRYPNLQTSEAFKERAARIQKLYRKLALAQKALVR